MKKDTSVIGDYILNIAYALIDARDLTGIRNLNGLVQSLMFDYHIKDSSLPLDELYEFLVNVDKMLRDNRPSDEIKKVCTDDLKHFVSS